MATTVKGGTLILDFKDEGIIGSLESPLQLKEDIFSKLKESKGKIITLINATDENMLYRHSVYMSLTSHFLEDEIQLELNGTAFTDCALAITKNNEAYIMEN